MNYKEKELESLGYTQLEIQEIQQLGLAELVVIAHAHSQELEQPESESRALTWATACLVLFSAVVLSAPWAGEIVEAHRSFTKAYKEEAHRSLLKEAFDGNEDYLEYEWSPVPENPSYRPEFGCLVHRALSKRSWNCLEGSQWEDREVNEWIRQLPDE